MNLNNTFLTVIIRALAQNKIANIIAQCCQQALVGLIL